MTHSISHTLILEINGYELTLTTVRKDGFVSKIDQHSLENYQGLEPILETLPEIYSDIKVLIRQKAFISVPESYYNADLTALYSLSYSLPEFEKMRLDKTEHGLGMVYFLETEVSNLIANKFPRATFEHEASVIVQKLFKEINFKQSRILMVINAGTLILFAINKAQLVLCNYYQANTLDDIFYFVMLVSEQLHFLPSETELIILGEPPNRIEIFDLFKNYIHEINIWVETCQISDEQSQTDTISSSFALQSLVCA